MLARRGLQVSLYERSDDPRLPATEPPHGSAQAAEQGRSINLALAARGIRALAQVGLMDRVRALLIPMRGRMIHERSGATVLQPYGQRDDEVIYSVGRAALNRLLIESAAQFPNIGLQFAQICRGVEAAHDRLTLQHAHGGAAHVIRLTPTIAADGAGSAVRSSLVTAGLLQFREHWLDHAYKELAVPPSESGPVLAVNALHIWPRGDYMLIALPNTDGSFTATLFLPRTGPNSFAQLGDSRAIEQLFATEFADAAPLIPDLAQQFARHPLGHLGSLQVAPWSVGGRVLLIGDAAHAIVPFHGQGMNAAFEDCLALDLLCERCQDWTALFEAFERLRRPDTAAIAQMALENYTEMRATVLDADFARRRALAAELERRFPQRFIPRYSMVSFHPEIPYAEALRRGAIQEEILARLARDRSAFAASDVDFDLAARLIHEQLPPLRGE